LIRIVTLDEFDPAVVKLLAKLLYQAFGVGTEQAGTEAAGTAEPLDAEKLLETLPKVAAYADDKVLFLTSRKLKPRALVSGEAPTYGLSRYNAQRVIVSAAQLKNLEEDISPLGRLAMQEIGHAFGLYHCLDARCAMYPQWTPEFADGDAVFCVFCRDQSDQKIRQLKS
jgi:predicted Zn-dependent protease